MSGFQWGWLYGIVLTVAGLFIVAGGVRALHDWWRWHKQQQWLLKQRSDDEWKDGHG